MANKPNITKLYDKIFQLKEMLSDAVNTAMEAANDAEAFGGEVSRVITGQLRQGFISQMQGFIDDEGNQASMAAMIKFLDSVPLAWVRSGPEQEAGMTAGADIIQGDPTAPQAPQAGGNPTAPNPTAPDVGMEGDVIPESAILASKQDGLKDHMRENWEAAHVKDEPVQGELDFRNFKEGFEHDPTPVQLKKQDNNRFYNSMLENSQKPTKRLDEDIIAGPYKHVEADGMEDWRKLMDDTDEKIETAMRG